jgi:hypothetical protein
MLAEHRGPRLATVLRAELAVAEARLGEDAADRLPAAVAAVRATGNPFPLAHALVDEAAWHIGHGDADRAAALLAEAAEIGTRLGAQPLLARIRMQQADSFAR